MPSRDFNKKRFKKLKEAFVDGLQAGKFEGDFRLEWIAPDLFMYYPDNNDPFRFIRKKANGKEEIITPQKMETDGGSIPRIMQVIPGLSPWEYGPAHIIHDWEFEAHDRARQDPNFKFNKSFKQVNLTFAEAIWTLMKVGYKKKKPKMLKSNIYDIHAAVSSSVAKKVWDDIAD
jgi:hypothetical protein